MKLASRFERLLKERRECSTSHGKNDDELLSELVSKYNSYKANAALKKWQISSDTQVAIWAIILGMDEVSRSLLRSHLDHNKWEESGALTRFFCLGCNCFGWLICYCFVCIVCLVVWLEMLWPISKATVRRSCDWRGTCSTMPQRVSHPSGRRSWLLLILS